MGARGFFPWAETMTKSVDPESNQGPSDLQSDALPTELSTVVASTSTSVMRPVGHTCDFKKIRRPGIEPGTI